MGGGGGGGEEKRQFKLMNFWPTVPTLLNMIESFSNVVGTLWFFNHNSTYIPLFYVIRLILRIKSDKIGRQQ